MRYNNNNNNNNRAIALHSDDMSSYLYKYLTFETYPLLAAEMTQGNCPLLCLIGFVVATSQMTDLLAGS